MHQNGTGGLRQCGCWRGSCEVSGLARVLVPAFMYPDNTGKSSLPRTRGASSADPYKIYGLRPLSSLEGETRAGYCRVVLLVVPV